MNPGWLKKLGVVLICIVGTITATPAPTQTLGGFIGALINQAIINSAVKSWNAVDPDVQRCLANNYGLSAQQLAQNGVSATDRRISGQMQSCQQAVAQARYQQQLHQQSIENAQAAWNAFDPDLRQCLASSSSIVPEQLAQQGIGPDDARVQAQIQNCRNAAALAVQQKRDAEARHDYIVQHFPNWVDAIESGKVVVGMTKDAVLEARGKPDSKDVIPPDDELWVYASERISISKGKVTYVEH